jgi:hypothetical protein
LYKIPPLFTVVDLSYSAKYRKGKLISGAVFAFAAAASVFFVIVMERFRPLPAVKLKISIRWLETYPKLCPLL